MKINILHIQQTQKIPVRKESITKRTGNKSIKEKSLFEKHDDFFNNLFKNL